MASAEVLLGAAASSSRKQGHLEAGKRRLEEFRKKKAEGKAKKVASADQLLTPDANHNEKLSKDRESVSERATSHGNKATEIDLLRSVNVYENDTAASRGTEVDVPRGVETDCVESDSKSHPERLSTEIVQDDGPRLYNNSKLHWSVDGLFHQGREENDFSSSREYREEFLDESSKGQQNAHYPVYPTTSTFDVKSKYSSSYSSLYPQLDGHKTSVDQYGKDQNESDTFQSNTLYSAGNTGSGFKQKKGLFSNTTFDRNDYATHEETAGVLQHRPGSMDHGGSVELNVSVNKIYDSSGHHLDAGSEPSHSSQSSSVNSNSTFKSSSSQQHFSSTISGPGSWRSRPSFFDFVNVPRPLSSSLSFPESAKADPTVPLNNSKTNSAEVQPLSSQKSEDNAFWQSARLVGPDSVDGKESSLNFSASLSSVQQLREEVGNGDGNMMQNFPIPTKDEDFSALEQHIEDLTQEKFSLQRALESSRTLAESLAAENSSLTESFNQQGKVVNQLKSDMEQLQEEVRAQLVALEAVKVEYANAQLECSAADERSKILASEVIGLEEKALRLRSNELKLEKQLEKSNAEINAYRKKVSSLEKERQDFQSTIEALQEEKKLLQSKVRKASSSGKVIDIGKGSSVKKDAFTSTEDLGIEPSNMVGENVTEMTSSAMVNAAQEIEARVLSSGNVSLSNFHSEAGSLSNPEASGVIPNDQIRMIDNINSLISELTLEKEELIQALRVQSTNNSKLMDLNKELCQKLETQTQRLELLTAQHMAGENALARPVYTRSTQEMAAYTDEGDEVVERVLGWIMKLFPGGPAKRRRSVHF